MREWEKAAPGQSRVPEAAVREFRERLERDGLIMHGFAMLDRGKLAAECYWAPFEADSLHRMYSVGKSFTGLAIGFLQEEGKLWLEDCICTYFPDKCPGGVYAACETSGDSAANGDLNPWISLHPWIARTTIRHMLTMTTCHRSTTYKDYPGDWVESFFRVPPTNLPGAVFSYDTSATHVLAALVERLSGKKLMEYLREKAFDKIGVSKEAYFMEDAYGVSMGGSGLNCTLRDVLAVAWLVTEGGRWEGEQLLPADFLREALSCQIPTLQQAAREEQAGYGYQIWQGKWRDSFFFYGIGGQLAVCFPREKFVLATMGNTLGNRNGIKDIFDAFEESIYPWIEEKENGIGGVQGKEYSPLEAQVSGRLFRFDENTLGLESLEMRFESGRCLLSMVKEHREMKLAFGREEYVRGIFPRLPEDRGAGTECLCQGAWVLEDYLVIRCHLLGENMAILTVGLRFQEGVVTVKMQKGADNILKNFEGVASSGQGNGI